MLIQWYKTTEDLEIEKRLQQFSLSYVKADPSKIEELSPANCQTVYLVSGGYMKQLLWNEVRVMLGKSPRFFIVCGKEFSSKEYVEYCRDGAYDVVTMNDSDERWKEAFEHAIQAQKTWLKMYQGASFNQTNEILLGKSQTMESLRSTINRVGATDATILITGESGVGKEKAAQALHQTHGTGPFVPLNCAAIPAELLESELFGAERGAFTGSTKDKKGLVEEAIDGTLFLDEIGEMSLMMQPKLLRFLETKIGRRVGSTKEYAANVRVLSATNRDLKAMVDQGTFRADLYYRLTELVIQVPPLRLRGEDIPILARYFMEKACERYGKFFDAIEIELIEEFQSYQWPGNIRELKNVLDRLVLFHNGPVMRCGWWQKPQVDETPVSSYSSDDTISAKLFLNRREKFAYACRLFKESGGDLRWVTSQLGIHPSTFYRWKKSGKLHEFEAALSAKILG